MDLLLTTSCSTIYIYVYKLMVHTISCNKLNINQFKLICLWKLIWINNKHHMFRALDNKKKKLNTERKIETNLFHKLIIIIIR